MITGFSYTAPCLVLCEDAYISVFMLAQGSAWFQPTIPCQYVQSNEGSLLYVPSTEIPIAWPISLQLQCAGKIKAISFKGLPRVSFNFARRIGQGSC